MIDIAKKICQMLLTVCLVCILFVPDSRGQESSEIVIIAPDNLSSASLLPVVVRIFAGLGRLDTTVSGSLSLDADYAYLATTPVAVKNGVGSVLTAVEASDDFSISLNGYSGEKTVSARTSLPIVQHNNRTVSAREIWSASEEHHVLGDLTVLDGGELIIEKGAAVLLGDKSNVTVNGTITAEGTEKRPITFIARDAGSPWGGIEVRSGTGSFAYCFLVLGGADTEKSFGHSDSQPVLKAYNATLAVDNCFFFDNTGKALGGYSSEIDIASSLLSRCDTGAEFKLCRVSVTDTYFTDIPSEDDSRVDDDNDFLYLSGIFPDNDEPSQVSSCYFVNGYDDGIDIHGAPVIITDTVFFDIADKAVSIGGAAKNVSILRNLIANTSIAVAVKDASEVLIDHSTIDDTDTGIYAYIKGSTAETGGTVTVTNSIFSRCYNAVIQYDSNSSIEVSYSLVDSELLPGTGNISGEPQFVSSKNRNYELRADSPAIDAGDPEIVPDEDASLTDIGAFPFNKRFERIVINEINYNSLDTYDPGDWLELYNPNEFPVDMSGWIFRDSNIAHAFVFPDAYVLAPGAYEVICANRSLFSQIFPDISPYPADMDFGLSGSGELLRLIDSTGIVVDSLSYDDMLPWPEEADGSGSTLSLINPELDNALPASWGPSAGYGTPGKRNDTFRYYNRHCKEVVTSLALEQNYPNPFKAVTTIPFILSKPGRVTLELYSISGQKLSTIVDKTMTSGHHEVPVNIEDASSGVYLYRITTAGSSKTKSMLLIK